MRYRQTNLWVRTDGDFHREITALLIQSHNEILRYAARNPSFIPSLTPLPFDNTAPPIVKTMFKAALEAGVGPMAAVAGAIAERVGRMLIPLSPRNVIVENGGDCFIHSDEDLFVGIYGGREFKIPRPLAIRIRRDQLPICVCTSSSTVGHSLSFGKAHAVTVFAKNGAFADAVATAVANSLRDSSQIEPILYEWGKRPEIIAMVAIVGDAIGFLGDIELV
ncbi:MAG: UPF0280 family protein [Syntrophobacterales bacterium]|nr:UPF0280 family protein [Syntrophobacterales bacterium]